MSPAAPKPSDSTGSRSLPACGFSVTGGKKGAIPIAVEKRAKGKKVTVISNVQGSAKSLLSALTSLLGVGGTLRQEASGQHWTVEVQGDQVDRVSAALLQLGCLRGIKRDEDSKEKKKEVEVTSRNCGYDKFLRRGEPSRGEAYRDARNFATFATPLLIEAECTSWHGPWIYCRGQCQKTDLTDVWEDTLDSSSKGTVDGGNLPAPPASLAELNLILRSMGMLAEVGEAARQGIKNAANLRNPASSGMTLAEYRRVALAPGARLIGDTESNTKSSSSSRRASSRVASRGASRASDEASTSLRRNQSCPRLTRNPPRPPAPAPKPGCFACQICGCIFGLQRTVKLHIRNAHPGEAVPTAVLPHKVVNMFGGTAQPPRTAREPSRPRFPEDVPYAVASSHSTATERKPKDLFSPKPMKPELRKDSITSPCPVCGKNFAYSAIEAHVEVCLAAAEAQTESSIARNQSTLNAVPQVPGHEVPNGVWIVTEDFEPTGEGCEVQLAIRKGQEVEISWQQPADEGGYWAFGCLFTRRESEGYFPLAQVTAAGSFAQTSGQVLSSPVAGQSIGSEPRADGSQVPDDWLETFLMLDLPQPEAERFWQAFEELREDMPMEAAWLAALEGVFEVLDTHATTEQAPITLAHATDSPPEAEALVVAPLATFEVTQDWQPDGETDGTQMTVHRGERLLLEWQQPVEEGGYWAFCLRESSPTVAGYVPLECLTRISPRHGNVFQDSDRSDSSRRQAWVKPDGGAGGVVALQDKLAINAVVAEDCHEDTSLGAGVHSAVADEEVTTDTAMRVGVAGEYVHSDAAPLDQGIEVWGQRQLERLTRRYCMSNIDPAVAFMAIFACSTANEMRGEATALIAENQTVKNFASELWRRKSSMASVSSQRAVRAH